MKYFCVISHTHWDREWYQPLEQFRLRLVDLIDRCLDLLEHEPEHIFHLDAQTVVLEDYLVIRPEKRELLRKYISAGQLAVGPWYLQNDFYLTSGEATIRNLLEGKRLAEEFGCCTNVGYAPDQFGNISQLPQILSSFGIDTFLFGRGFAKVGKDENGNPVRLPTPSEFIWKGPDGTEALAVHMSLWYNNAQHFSADMQKAKRLTDDMETLFCERTATPYILMMNGVDHLEAQEDLLPILTKLDDALGEERTIRQYRMDEYFADVKQYINQNHITLPVHKGELRSGGNYELLQGTLSSRVYLKQANVLLQNRLESQLEPLYAMLEQNGLKGSYSTGHFRYMWKELMKNHPHDSICGCSRDEVHDHMEDRFHALSEITEDLLKRGMEIVADHMRGFDSDFSDYGLLIANTTEQERSEIVRVKMEFPVSDQVDGFSIYDPMGRKAEFRVCSREKSTRCTLTPLNLPRAIPIERMEIEFWVQELPALSFRAYTVKKKADPSVLANGIPQGGHMIENAKLRITVSEDGRVDLLDKKAGVW